MHLFHSEVCLASEFQVICGGISSTIKLPCTTPKEVPLSLPMHAEIIGRTPPPTPRIVRVFIQLPAFSTIHLGPILSTIGDHALVCRRYCKKKTLIFAGASINVHLLLSFCFLRLLCFSLLVSCSVFTHHGFYEMVACLVLVLRLQYCAIYRYWTLVLNFCAHVGWGFREVRARRLVLVL
ncbi:hypothetical protein EDB19DRAFT_1667617 [Suillus lakei]|nr:hypothetical protein EDB19DRAFT_1782276 [Suillus lakei]KAG1753157.1 hypothetical protein EDB19DRAFT_1667617 [Suillus lakei]